MSSNWLLPCLTLVFFLGLLLGRWVEKTLVKRESRSRDWRIFQLVMDYARARVETARKEDEAIANGQFRVMPIINSISGLCTSGGFSMSSGVCVNTLSGVVGNNTNTFSPSSGVTLSRSEPVVTEQKIAESSEYKEAHARSCEAYGKLYEVLIGRKE